MDIIWSTNGLTLQILTIESLLLIHNSTVMNVKTRMIPIDIMVFVTVKIWSLRFMVIIKRWLAKPLYTGKCLKASKLGKCCVELLADSLVLFLLCQQVICKEIEKCISIKYLETKLQQGGNYRFYIVYQELKPNCILK